MESEAFATNRWAFKFMDYELGFFDEENLRFTPGENPFKNPLLPVSAFADPLTVAKARVAYDRDLHAIQLDQERISQGQFSTALDEANLAGVSRMPVAFVPRMADLWPWEAGFR